MKLGVITDIHNNSGALEAVLSELSAQECERILCGGDLIGIGPEPEATVQRMMHLPGCVAVRGNHEGYLLDGMDEARMGREEYQYHLWEHARLSQTSIDYLRSLPYALDLTVEGVRIHLVHAPRSARQGGYMPLTPHPTPEQLAQWFHAVDADVICYGHDHARCIAQAEGKWFVNAGSLGCPMHDGDLARAAILTVENGSAAVTPLDVRYDANAVVARIDQLNYPAAQEVKSIFFSKT